MKYDDRCDDEWHEGPPRRSHREESLRDERPHDWDRADMRREPARRQGSWEGAPGPDGAPKPPYNGPRNREQRLVREWHIAYEQACSQVRVEILKEKIRKTWGKSIERVAVEVDKLMYKDWQLCQKEGDHSKEREKLVGDLAKTILESYKKGPRSRD